MTLRAADLLLAASRHPLAREVQAGLVESGVGGTERLLLGVSGGSDSMAMLVLVAAVRARNDRTLDSIAVLACDHGLRPEAAEECASVLGLCERLGVRHASLARLEVDRRGNLLAAAREARLAALWSSAAGFGTRSVLLAHQADDLAEGLLLALARGGGLASVDALVARREFAEGVLCRPLLEVRRRALRDFLEELGVAWHDDPGNAMRARGELRTEPAVAALVERIAGGCGDLVREASGLRVVRDALARELAPEGARSVARAAFDAAPPSVRAALIVRLAAEAGGSLARSAVEDAVRSAGESDRRPRVYAGRGGVLRVDARTVEWIRTDAADRVTGD